jgi:hypothetical protein
MPGDVLLDDLGDPTFARDVAAQVGRRPVSAAPLVFQGVNSARSDAPI